MSQANPHIASIKLKHQAERTRARAAREALRRREAHTLTFTYVKGKERVVCSCGGSGARGEVVHIDPTSGRKLSQFHPISARQ